MTMFVGIVRITERFARMLWLSYQKKKLRINPEKNSKNVIYFSITVIFSA